MHEVTVPSRDAARLRRIAGADAGRRYDATVDAARGLLAGRTVWHINSTGDGGGVAEILRSCLGYLADDGIAVRWLVIDGDPRFFEITKRLHNRLHGVLGDGGPLGGDERAHFDAVTAANRAAIEPYIGPDDVVVVHDPQPLGLVPWLTASGVTTVWTCHIGVDVANDIVRSAWDFLLADARAATATTFTRGAYVWERLAPERVRLIPPCIDPSSAKNVGIEPARRPAILSAAGLIAPSSIDTAPIFLRSDGSSGMVAHRAEMTEDAPVPTDAPLVVQVSRWDGLKDPVGVMQGFADDPGLSDAHLILAGPGHDSVADDPEADAVLSDVTARRAALPAAGRRRLHLANLPMVDTEENAIIVNALQRWADVVAQKSLAEGFGLTVTEAMWKARPVVAADVGGIREQIDDGVSGLLVDPRDLMAFGNAVQDLLDEPERAAVLASAAEARVRDRYLPTQYLGAYLELFTELR